MQTLEQALDYDHFQDPFATRWGVDLGSMNSTPHLWAVFSLMKIEEALGWSGWIKGNRWHSSSTSNVTPTQLAIAGSSALEAALAFAEMGRIREIRLAEIGAVHKDQQQRRADSRDGASKRLAVALASKIQRRYAAWDWAWDEWCRIGVSHYRSNKAEFARDYVIPKVRELFTTAGQKPVEVKERQVTEVWLKRRREGRD
jgi:hypothetical protein